MNANKILSTALLSAVVAASSLAGTCSNSGFYVGVDAAVNFTSMKVESTTTYEADGEHLKAGQSCTVKKEKVQYFKQNLFEVIHFLFFFFRNYIIFLFFKFFFIINNYIFYYLFFILINLIFIFI